MWEYTTTQPGKGMYYCHHPWGIFWSTAVLMKVFGRHDFICRLAPVLLSAATPPLLSALARITWNGDSGASMPTRITSLGLAFTRLREKTQKPVVCHANGFDNSTAWFAVRACSRVWLSPAGDVDTVGIGAQVSELAIYG